MGLHAIAHALLLASIGLVLPGNGSPASGANEPAVYVVVFRTPAHVRASKPEVFHGFSKDLREYLEKNNVPIKVDPERGTIETESPMSVESMVNIAKQLDASSLLFVTVDRPVTKWIKVTVESYDLSGKLLWSEQASDAGSMTGKGGYNKTLDRIEDALSSHLGNPGLPTSVTTSAEESVKP